ncbi:sulfatase [Labilibacter sediminis]|nr:sulfatase [Labilibacter sediminis]
MNAKIVLILFIPFILGCSKENKSKKPNILFFLVDDMGWADVGYQGSQVYKTPSIDKLAASAMQFENAYVTHPRCVPSRYSIYTGKYPARIDRPGPGKMPLEDFTIAEALKEIGYSTFFTGKWHLAMGGISFPENQGFDINIGGGHPGAPISYFWPYNEPPHHQFKDSIHGLETGETGEYLTDRLTTETIKYIKQHNSTNPDQPFFAMVSHYAVHEPLEAKQEYIDKFQKIIDTTQFQHPEYLAESNGLTKMRQDYAPYAAMVYSVDESLGKIMQTLEDLDIDENTIIFFFSDNGGLSNTGTEKRLLATSNYPLRAGKGHLYEGGVRVPLIVKWPEYTRKGARSKAVVTGCDFYPTILNMVEKELLPEHHLDGESFTWALKEKENPNPDRAVYWHNGVARPVRTGDYYSSSVRQGKYKLIDYYKQNRVELYDVEADFMETKNLAQELPELADSLQKQVIQWRDEIDVFYQPDKKKSKWE